MATVSPATHIITARNAKYKLHASASGRKKTGIRQNNLGYTNRSSPVFAGLLLLGWIGKYIYMVDGEIDWFRFMLVYGVPVGIPHMFIIIPWHWDLSGILGMAALCVIVGGIFGCVIAAWLGIRAVWYMVGFPISKIVAIHKRTC